MLAKIKWFCTRKRVRDLYQLIMDFLAKCNDDHVAAFGAMSTFFILLSFFPFLIFILTLAKYMPFSKDDVLYGINQLIPMEETYFIESVVNSIYRKTGASVFTLSIVAAIWSSSRAFYSLVKGLNSVYDIEDRRNYFVIRFFSMFYTVLFAIILVIMMIMWVFGNQLYEYICIRFPFLLTVADVFIHRRTFLTLITLIFIFMLIYQFATKRKTNFFRQLPGACIAAFSWIIFSKLSGWYMDSFNLNFIYGSMATIMMLLIWLYFCMSMVFYGAEVNYFLENKDNYHTLVRILRPSYLKQLHDKEEEIKHTAKQKEKKEEEK